MTEKKKAVAYLRVSTTKQGILGLGIEAQRQTVAAFCEQRGYRVVKEFVEAESGRKNVRRELERARSHARLTNSTLIVAKMDRLSRDVDMIRAFLKGGERVAFCDFPEIPEGPVGKFMLTAMAMMAEFESGLIGQRTKAALAAKKLRGEKVGNPESLRAYHANRTKPHDRSAAMAAVTALSFKHVTDVAPHIQALREEGITGFGEISRSLNEMQIPAPRGGKWHRATVMRVVHAMPQ